MEHGQEKNKKSPASYSTLVRDHYETLHVSKNASAKEIREAYFRLKNTYSHNNQALYSLVEDTEASETIGHIDEAYNILSSTHDRVKHDLELIANNKAVFEDFLQELHQEVNRTSSVVSLANLAASSTAATREGPELSGKIARRRYYSSQEGTQRSGAMKAGKKSRMSAAYSGAEEHNAAAGTPTLIHVRRITAKNACQQEIQEKVTQLIAEGDPSDGSLFKKIRETVGIDKQEMQDHIKISIGYIDNIEENHFDLLPQPVYVKGFLKSYLKYLGVQDYDKLVKAYFERFNTWFESKNP